MFMNRGEKSPNTVRVTIMQLVRAVEEGLIAEHWIENATITQNHTTAKARMPKVVGRHWFGDKTITGVAGIPEGLDVKKIW